TGRITPPTPRSSYPVPTANSGPDAITSGPDGNLWFAEALGNQIGRVTVSSAGLTISPAAALPTITGPVTLDGTTEPGIQVNGGGQNFDGLTLGSGSNGSRVLGLSLANFGGAGIVITNAANVTIGGT